MAKSIRRLASAGLAAAFALAWMAPAWADAPAEAPSMDAVPLVRQFLDCAPPKDAVEYAVLQNQLNQLGFTAAASKLDTYERWRLLSMAMPPPAREAATLREVIAGPSVEDALRATVGRIATDGIAVAFPSAAEADGAPAPKLQMTQQGLEHYERLAPGLWGLFKGKDANPALTPMQASAFYIAADIRNRMAEKADIRLQYDMAPALTLTCDSSDVAAAGHRYGLCEVTLAGKVTGNGGSRWIPLTPQQNTSVFESLIALQQSGPTVPKTLWVHFTELHLTVDSETGANQVRLDDDWRAEAAAKARMALQAASCHELGTCASGLSQKLTSTGGISTGLTLLAMVCLVAYRFRRGGSAGIWPAAAKLYAVLFVLAIAIHAMDRPTGATRGAPLSGTLGFMAKVAVSMPWSYYFVAGMPDTGARPGLAAKPLADDSPWFWGFAGINLVFLALMAASADSRTRNIGSIT